MRGRDMISDIRRPFDASGVICRKLFPRPQLASVLEMLPAFPSKTPAEEVVKIVYQFFADVSYIANFVAHNYFM